MSPAGALYASMGGWAFLERSGKLRSGCERRAHCVRQPAWSWRLRCVAVVCAVRSRDVGGTGAGLSPTRVTTGQQGEPRAGRCGQPCPASPSLAMFSGDAWAPNDVFLARFLFAPTHSTKTMPSTAYLLNQYMD